MNEKIYTLFQNYYNSNPNDSVADFITDFWSGHLTEINPEYSEDLKDLFSRMIFAIRGQTNKNGQRIIDIASGRAFVGGTIKATTEVFPNVLPDGRRENILLLMGDRRDIALHLLCGDVKQIREALFSALGDKTYVLDTPNTWIDKHWDKYALLFDATEGLPASTSLSNWHKAIYPNLQQILKTNLELVRNSDLHTDRVHTIQSTKVTDMQNKTSFKFAIKRVIGEMFLILLCILLLWIYTDKDAVLFALLPYSIGVAVIFCILIINEYDKLRSRHYPPM